MKMNSSAWAAITPQAKKQPLVLNAIDGPLLLICLFNKWIYSKPRCDLNWNGIKKQNYKVNVCQTNFLNKFCNGKLPSPPPWGPILFSHEPLEWIKLNYNKMPYLPQVDPSKSENMNQN